MCWVIAPLLLSLAAPVTGGPASHENGTVIVLSLAELGIIVAIVASLLAGFLAVTRWYVLHILSEDKQRQGVSENDFFERAAVHEKLVQLLRKEDAQKAIAEALGAHAVRDALATAVSSPEVGPHIAGVLATSDARDRIASFINSDDGRRAVAAALNSEEAETVVVGFLNREKGRYEISLALNSPQAMSAIAQVIVAEESETQLLQFLASDSAQKRIAATLDSAGAFGVEHLTPAITAYLISKTGRERLTAALREPDVAPQLLENVLMHLFMDSEKSARLAKYLRSPLVARPGKTQAIVHDALQQAMDLEQGRTVEETK